VIQFSSTQFQGQKDKCVHWFVQDYAFLIQI